MPRRLVIHSDEYLLYGVRFRSIYLKNIQIDCNTHKIGIFISQMLDICKKNTISIKLLLFIVYVYVKRSDFTKLEFRVFH